MKKSELKKLITETVINELNEAAAWSDIESKIDKWFKLSPGLTGNIQSVEVKPSQHGIAKNIVLHDKRGNNIILVGDASTEFTDKYMPYLTNLLSTISGQEVKQADTRIAKFI